MSLVSTPPLCVSIDCVAFGAPAGMLALSVGEPVVAPSFSSPVRSSTDEPVPFHDAGKAYDTIGPVGTVGGLAPNSG